MTLCESGLLFYINFAYVWEASKPALVGAPTCPFENKYQYIFYFRAFDVELLYIAQFLQIPIAEVAVNWTEIEGECSLYLQLVLNRAELLSESAGLRSPLSFIQAACVPVDSLLLFFQTLL